MRSLKVAVAAALVVLSATPASAEPVNRAPVVVDDAVAYRNTGGIDYPVTALANDSDPDGDALTYVSVTPAGKGNAYLQDGTLFYKPYFRESGTDSFTYTVSDGQGNTATGTVTATLWVDPGAPGNAAISIPVPGSATLTWSAADGAVEYRIYLNGALVHTTTDLSWTATGLLDTGYYYWNVYAFNGGGWPGGASYSLSRYPKLPTPEAVHAGGTDDPTTVKLTWDARHMTGPWNVYRDGVLIGSSHWAGFEDTGLVTGHEYSYQVELVGGTTAQSVYPPSSLSAAVRATPGVLTGIGQLFRDLGGSSGPLGPIITPERGIPGGRQQDHQNGYILEQTGRTALTVTHPVAGAYFGAPMYGAMGDLGFPVAEQESGLRDGGFGQLFEGGSIWGSSHTPTRAVRQVIEDGWAEAGWEEGPLGYPVADQVTLPRGISQLFEDGGVYWSAATGSHAVAAENHDTYTAWGGPSGRLGFPTTGDNCGLRGGGCWQGFQGGAIHWSPATGAHATDGMIREAWGRLGWENGRMGYPTGGVVCGLRGGGCWQPFQGGAIHWSPATGAHATDGMIREAWGRLGWENGRMGYPTGGVVCGLRGGGCWQPFQGGAIHWSPATGAHATDGMIREAWGRLGWENGRMGYPTGGVVCGLRGGGCWQPFQGGTIHWSPATGAHATDGMIREAWGRLGWENGRMGYPTGGVVCGLRGGGCWQPFQGGTIHWSPTTGAHATDGMIREAWGRLGWENGRMGYPTGGVVCSLRGGGCWQPFQGGTIHWSPTTGAHATDGMIREAWGRLGWENGRMGYPTGGVVCGLRGGGCWQPFQGGAIHWSPATGAHATFGAIRDAWGRQGWENGRLGYPVSGEMVSGGVVRQNFQGGYITVDRRTGRVTVR